MISPILMNIALMLFWMMLNRDTSLLNGVLGFVLSAIIIDLGMKATGKPAYLTKLLGLARFAIYFVYILVKANLDVAWEIITPGYAMKPRMMRYDVTGLSPIQVTTLASAITLTPGTLSADINNAGNTLYIHAMYAEQKKDAIQDLDQLRDKLLRLVFHTDIQQLRSAVSPNAQTSHA